MERRVEILVDGKRFDGEFVVAGIGKEDDFVYMNCNIGNMVMCDVMIEEAKQKVFEQNGVNEEEVLEQVFKRLSESIETSKTEEKNEDIDENKVINELIDEIEKIMHDTMNRRVAGIPAEDLIRKIAEEREELEKINDKLSNLNLTNEHKNRLEGIKDKLRRHIIEDIMKKYC